MATVQLTIPATPAEVFAVFCDGWLYSNWVVGTSHVRAVEADWPAVGSRVFHASGAWPAVIRDETVVEQVEPDARLVLTARGWPIGEARVDLRLVATEGGTLVTMIEAPVAGPGKWLNNPAIEAVIARRNVESLARLSLLATRPVRPAD